MKLKVEELLKDYYEFVDILPDSAYSYKSYLTNACKHFFDETFQKHFGLNTLEFICNCSTRSRQFVATFLLMILNNEYQNNSGKVKKKTISNYKSALSIFQVFIDETDNPESEYYAKYKGGKNRYDELLKIFSFNTYYLKKDLLKNFRFRINTQDRIYRKDNVCFPCRLLSKIYSGNRKYVTNLDEMIGRCKILVSNKKDDFVVLKKVRGLEITSQGYRLDFSSKKKDAYIYSEIFEKRKSIMIKRIVGELSDISLDHDRPLFEIIPEFISNNHFSEYKKINDSFFGYSEQNRKLAKEIRLSLSRLTTKFYEEIYPTLNINEDVLLEEIKALFDIIELTIMDKASNSSKNKY